MCVLNDLLSLSEKASFVPNALASNFNCVVLYRIVVLKSGSDLESDHPGFNDPVYRERRQELASIAQSYKIGHTIPHIQYTNSELQTW